MAREHPPVDDQGRWLWVVTWGRVGRSDGRSLLVWAHDSDDALAVAAAARPEWLRPDAAVLASPAVARAELDGNPSPLASHLPRLPA